MYLYNFKQNLVTMKKVSILIILLAFGRIVNSQEAANFIGESSLSQLPNSHSGAILKDETALSKFALSINPLGFVQFGPIVNAEFGLTKNLVLNTHLRFSSLGLLSYVIMSDDDGLDKYSGIAFGGGPIYFFGERRNKPYIGLLLEYEIDKMLYAQGENWEWSETSRSVVFAFNGGYRFRFNGGFFMNAGAYFGGAFSNWAEEYAHPTYIHYGPDEGSEVTPFGMLELAFGLEF